MNEKFATFTLFLFSILTFSQIQIKVLDKNNKKPIPYAKLILRGKNDYRNTEENGEVTLEKGEEIYEIESFGYEKLNVSKQENTYYLKPKFKEIEEVEIAKPTFRETFTVGSTKKDNFGFMGSQTSWSVVDFFENNHTEKKLFIKKIKIPTEVKEGKPDAVFNLVFHENINGKSSLEKLKNVIVSCKKGKNITEIDFSKNPITMPKEGLFIGVEWIINEQNHYLAKMTKINPDGSKEENAIVDRINPFFYGYQTKTSNTFSSSKSNWFKMFDGKENIIPPHHLSMELELTN
ncbi:hypothetical protein [Chryseobacterium sp. MMS23-Vi53]|uniref:hypothetical protein n=1 Tax=Chryseobacterium sp. MMS23-Vi53 TaxID=3386644 RepID=UPI0039E8D84F